MGIKHAHQTGLPNDPSKDVSADAWNDDHVIAAPLAITVPDNTSAITMSGYNITSGTSACFDLSGTIDSNSPPLNVFNIDLVNLSFNTGNAFRIGLNNETVMACNLGGDLTTRGGHRALSLYPLSTGGVYYYAYFIGGGFGGDVGLYAGLSSPTVDTFGRPGSLYMNADTGEDGLPWYGTDGSAGWGKLAGQDAAQPLTNKTQMHLTPQTAPSSPASGWVLYVDSADGTLKAKNASGTVRSLAAP